MVDSEYSHQNIDSSVELRSGDMQASIEGGHKMSSAIDQIFSHFDVAQIGGSFIEALRANIANTPDKPADINIEAAVAAGVAVRILADLRDQERTAGGSTLNTFSTTTSKFGSVDIETFNALYELMKKAQTSPSESPPSSVPPATTA